MSCSKSCIPVSSTHVQANSIFGMARRTFRTTLTKTIRFYNSPRNTRNCISGISLFRRRQANQIAEVVLPARQRFSGRNQRHVNSAWRSSTANIRSHSRYILDGLVDQRISLSVDQSVGQSINQSVSESVNQSVSQSVIRPVSVFQASACDRM